MSETLNRIKYDLLVCNKIVKWAKVAQREKWTNQLNVFPSLRRLPSDVQLLAYSGQRWLRSRLESKRQEEEIHLRTEGDG